LLRPPASSPLFPYTTLFRSAQRVDRVVSGLRRNLHYTVDENARNVQLLDRGIRVVEAALECGNLFDERNFRINTAVQDALHAHRSEEHTSELQSLTNLVCRL